MSININKNENQKEKMILLVYDMRLIFITVKNY